MKMQKVEVEIPEFNGYEFYGITRINNLPKNKNGFAALFHDELIDLRYVHQPNIELVIYKNKTLRKIIYQEVREDYIKRGDFYRDDDGDVNMWISDMQSREKHPIIEKIRDEFEVIMDKEYKEIVRENFLQWIEKDTGLAKEEYKEIIGIMYLAWLEATIQADERNAIK